MVRQVGTLSLLALSVIGCARTVRVESESPGILEPVVMPTNSRYLPAGTDLYVELDNRIGTRDTRVGDIFSATVRHAVYAQNGARVVPVGAKVYGRVTDINTPTFMGEPAAIRLDFNRLAFGGRSYPFDARIASTEVETLDQPHRSFNERLILATTAIGAALGAVISGGEIGGILGGAAIGAVGGVIYSYARGGGEVLLPAGSRMTLRTAQPVALRTAYRARTTTRRRPR